MGTVESCDIADKVYRAIPDLPTALSGTAILDNVNDARMEVAQYTGVTISETAIEEKYQPVITELAKGHTYATMSGKGAGFDFSVTEFKVNKSGNIHEDRANSHYVRAARMLKTLPFGGFSFLKANG